MARHVAGGELYYNYMGPGTTSGTSVYRISLRLFRDCSSNGPLLENESVTVGVYADNVIVASLRLDLEGGINSISLNTASFPCLVGNVNVCYQFGTWASVITLADNNQGYTLSRTGCCRVDNISNLAVKTSVGSNYVTRIPGRNTLPSGHNSSPQFLIKDTALVCANKSFKLDFGAVDPDGDVLTFALCDAYTAGSGSNNTPPSSGLSLLSLPYASPFNGSFPLGSKVTINPTTGIISGIAPDEGSYVVNVCITEWRNGKAFSEHRKDFILKVQNCDIIEAVLPEKIIQCNDFKVHFENLSTSSSITSYEWRVGDTSSKVFTDPTLDYTYADTGTFKATLNVTGPKGCLGAANTTVIVYPGFKPAFNIVGSCFLNPFQFIDATTTKYGTVNSWLWNLGDEGTDADTFSIKNPKYQYLTPATKIVNLVVTSSKGCIDSLHKDLVVSDKPNLQLPFRDTLICSIDTLAIPVLNSGNFLWTSTDKNILFANTAKPLVFPKTTSKYYVALSDNGCSNNDSVTVNVLPFIKVDLGNDTLICKTDTIRLRPFSQALGYQWKSSSGEVVASEKFPVVQPLVNTKYFVIANLGKCQDKDSVLVKVVPLPTAMAGPDTTICFGNRFQLKGAMIGSKVFWTPSNSLINPNTINPFAGPSKTTNYIMTVSDTLGCPKTMSDTLLVVVIPPVIANAGRDTSAVPGQSIQLIASGGQNYIWSPEIFLNDPSIFNPVATIGEGIDSIRYIVRVYSGQFCYAEDDVVIRIYRNGPDILVPTAFTPNADGKNDILRPITIGIAKLHYFSVYNRWGQLMFTTTEFGKGWDGMYGGSAQPAATYVFSAEGTDYLGKTVFRKGTSVLIR
jgi:gliding motility-associated-like protein